MKTIKLLLTVLLIASLNSSSHSQTYGWVALSPVSIIGTPNLSDIYFIDDTTGWLTTSSFDHIYKTSDGGLTFTTQNTALPTEAIHMLSATEGYCGGASGFVYRTLDGGNTWSFFGSSGNTITDIVFPPGGGNGYGCGLNGSVLSISSMGVSTMNSGVNSNLDCLSFPMSSQEGWVCGNNIIRHYTNGSWVADQINITGSWNAIYFVDNQNGWVAGDNGIIKHTTDGHTWSAQTNPDQNSLFGIFFINVYEGWAVGSNGTILHTIDGGTAWNLDGAGLTNAFLTKVFFTSSSNGYISGNGKTLLKYTQIAGGAENESMEGFTIYPNPSRKAIRIEIPDKQQIEYVSLCDVTGRNITRLERLSCGEIDIGSLPPGIYSITVVTNSQIFSQKVIRE